ncbi:restriction endonuclease subunit S [Dialister micraerophilus]|uniref:Type I restriction modification DNA specificity domain-containing protein n=1 Tax=Dialister micraerophilus DSM 19965 TaxID=888062 RepID=F2BXT4_9FIRM|nr:restriction endonuclease subunit S [Dialister micraerophilus]EGF12872.1 hypothetical protein HMPREF9083_1002 [Dialister micraerophilus DSM 19965]
MVNSAAKKLEKELIEIVEVPKEDINWSSVSLTSILNKGKRLEASVFDVECKHARDLVKKSIYGYTEIDIDKDLIDCYTRPRFKRIWLDKSEYPIYQPTSMLDIYPKNDGYISKLTETNIESLRVLDGQILITCSGTIGKVSFVSETLNGKIFSHDLLRIRFKNDYDNGYFYTFLKTNVGNSILKSNKYGSVISHIEAEHINEVLLPKAPLNLKKTIHDLILQSYAKRDESNKLIDEATKIMIDELELPPIEELKKEAFSYSKDINSFSTKLSDLDGRLEGSYHIPVIDVIEKYMSKHADLRYLDDKALVKDIILPGRFTRIYVTKEHGVPFIGGKDLFQLKSETGKYLSKKAHKNRLEKELLIKENSIILPSRGTLGSVMMAMSHQIGKYAISDNLIQMQCEKDYVGYIYIFLNSIYGEKLIYRQKYGGVVNAIEPIQLKKVSVPFLKDVKKIEQINNIAFKANELRYQAYKQEQEAINIMNKEVLGL